MNNQEIIDKQLFKKSEVIEGFRYERARLFANKFWCRGCKDYLKYDNFQRDATKRYGINTLCKKCRAEKGNGN